MKFKQYTTLLLALLFSLSLKANAENLYQITLLRASPGLLPDLIELTLEQKKTSKEGLIIMRHSQGDHWDLMLLMPVGDGMPEAHNYQLKADFQHDFLAKSASGWDVIEEISKEANLFHIEMFQASKGMYAGLLEQRHMENNYLEATQRNANHIFETTFGSDTDLFTLGIYSDLLSFAKDPDLDSEVFEKAATDAGFKARSDIGFYLRRFINGHQDTLATQVK